MSNRLESLEVTNDTVFKGTVYGTELELTSIEFSNYITNGTIIISENTISNIENENIEISTNDSMTTAGNINLSVGTGTITDGNLNFNVGGINYRWPSSGPTTNGQALTVVSGGGTNSVVLGWV